MSRQHWWLAIVAVETTILILTNANAAMVTVVSAQENRTSSANATSRWEDNNAAISEDLSENENFDIPVEDAFDKE